MLFVFLTTVVNCACETIAIRKEWRQLTSQQQTAYLSAVTKLHAKPQTSEDPLDWNSSQFGKYHFDTYNENHSIRGQSFQPTLLPWHRVFIHRYEAALRKIDPEIILPYWDWTINHQTPLDNPVMKAFGSEVDGNNCLSDGVAAGWSDHQGTCLKRFTNSNPFWSPQSVVDIVERNRNYRNFQDQLEFGPHPVVHMTIGGVGGQFSSSLSANEPLFFLHHAMVDKIWQMWQGCAGLDGSYAGSTSQILNPFGTAVRETFSTTAGEYCYTYSRSSIEDTVKIQCQSNWLQGWITSLIVPLNQTSSRASLNF